MNISALEERLSNLEIKFSFQQDSLDTLSEEVTKQWQQIDLLNKTVNKLKDQLVSLEDDLHTSESGNLPEPPPPHY